MARELKTAEEIREIIQAEVDKIPEVVEDGATVGIPLPYGHAPDESGANWNVQLIRNGWGYLRDIKHIVDEARKRYLLK